MYDYKKLKESGGVKTVTSQLEEDVRTGHFNVSDLKPTLDSLTHSTDEEIRAAAVGALLEQAADQPDLIEGGLCAVVVCPIGYECKQDETTGNGTCATKCTHGYCHNSGTCIHIQDEDVYCSCNADPTGFYMGGRCEFYASQSLVIGLGAGVGGLLLLIIIILSICLCCCRRQREELDFERTPPDKSHLTLYETMAVTNQTEDIPDVMPLNERQQEQPPHPVRTDMSDVKGFSNTSFISDHTGSSLQEATRDADGGPTSARHLPQQPLPLKIMATNNRELTWNDISLTSKLLGTGNFGEVRKGTVNLRVPSAIKVLKRGADETARRDFQQEVDIMQHVGYHPNIINLLGTCDHQGQQYMALEMAGNGDLKKYLRMSRVLETTSPAYANIRQTVGTVSTLSPVQLLRIACDVATGMKHLSSKDVIHRDLAARNVLLTDSLIAKVADFGLSRARGEGIYKQTSKRAVPFRSTALEALSSRIYTTQSDVWSFGILLWEIVTLGGTPYSGMKSRTLLRRLREGYRLPKPRNCDEGLYQMMLQCWQRLPEDRPTFSDLVEQLKGMMVDKSGYVNIENDDDFEYAIIDSDDNDDMDDGDDAFTE